MPHSISPGKAVETLRRNRMMEHLMLALRDHQDIGHYGRLVFVMVARHFMDEDLMTKFLTRDPDMTDEVKTRAFIRQIVRKGYNPPTIGKIREFQAVPGQKFQIIPDTDPDDNIYRDLEFPQEVYDNISRYYEDKVRDEMNDSE